MYIGMDDSAGGNLFGSGDPYGASIGTPNSTSLSFATNNLIQARIGSDGDVVFGPLTYARRQANVSIHRSGNVSMALVAGTESSTATMFFGLPCLPNSAGNNAYKTAIIAQPSGSGWSTANLHFCLRSTSGTNGQSSNDPALANATINDSKMVVTHTGRVGINTTAPTDVFHVAGTSRIDGLLTANQVYFFARHSVSSFSTWFAFGDTPVTNLGNSFSSTTRRFTAPYTGVYIFQACIIGVNEGHVGLAYNADYPDSNNYCGVQLWQISNSLNTFGTWIVKLNVNDYVRIVVFNSGNLTVNRCYISGALLHGCD